MTCPAANPCPAGPSGSRTRNYLLGLSSGYVVTFATVVVGLWLTPFTLRFLDREQYAIFTLTGDLLMWLTLLDLGIAAGLRLQAAQLAGHPDRERLSRLASTAFFAQNAIVGLVLLVGIGLALVYPEFFPIRPDLKHDASWLMVLLVLGMGLTVGTQTFSALLIANQQIHIDNAIALLNLVTRTVLTVVLLLLGWGLYSLAVAHLAAKLTSSSLAVVRTYRLLPGLQLRWRHVSWSVLKQTGGLGLWFTLGGLAGILISSLDRLVTAKTISVEMVTTLLLTGRMYDLSRGLLDQVTNNARPMLGQLMGQGKLADAARVYHHLFVLSTGMALVASAAVWAGNQAFVTRWVGGGNYGGWLLDLGLALNLVAHCWALPNRAALAAGMFKVPQHALSRVVEGGLNLLLAVILGRCFGLPGIVFAMSLTAAAVSCWYLPVLTAQMFQQSFLRFVRGDLEPILALLVLLLPLAWAGRQFGAWLGGGFPGAAAAGACTFAAGMGLMWLFSMDRALKQHVTTQLATVRTRLVRRWSLSRA